MSDLTAQHYANLVRETTLPTSNSLTEKPMKGVMMECALSRLFFGPLNVGVVQQELRYRVFQATGTVVGNQSEFELYCVMHGVYLQDARHLDTGLAQQVRELNERVYAYCVPNVASNVLQYRKYISEVGRNPTPMDRGAFASSAGTRTREFTGF